MSKSSSQRVVPEIDPDTDGTQKTFPSPEPKSFMNEPLPEAKVSSTSGPAADAKVERDDGTRPRDPENPERSADEPEEWRRSVGPSAAGDGPTSGKIAETKLPGIQDPRMKHQNFRRPG